MDPFLIATNVLVAGIGLSIFVVSAKINRRWQQAVVQISGVLLILAAALMLPSRAVQSVSQEAIVQDAPDDDDSSTLLVTQEGAVITDEATGKTIIITQDRSLVDLLRRAIQGKSVAEEEAVSLDDPDEEESDYDERPTRDPFDHAQITVEDEDGSTSTPEPVAQATPAPTPSPTPVPAPTRTREYDLPVGAGGLPACSGSSLLHGEAGGPDADGCYAVGCQEGYAVPMRLIGGSWQGCTAYARLPRLGDCYFVVDHDGKERSMRFAKGEWKSGTCKEEGG